MLSPAELTLLIVIGVVLALIVSNTIRPDLAAILALLALSFSGIVTPQEALSGFSSSAVVTIIGLFIITSALEETGIVQWLANQLYSIGGGSERRLVVIFMATGALLSLIMNNIAAGAVLLPAAVRVGRQSNVRPSKLLIPLAFGTLVGGMATLLTTANIVLSSILQEQGQSGLGMLDFLPTGGLIVLTTLVYMAVIGRRLLPDRDSAVSNIAQPAATNLRQTYQLDERLWEVRIPRGSELVNTALSHSRIGEELGITVIAIWRRHEAILAPEPIEIINADDYLLLLGQEERVKRLATRGAIIGRENGNLISEHDFSVELTEVIIPPRSNAIGKTLKDLRFRNKFGLTSVALWRGGRSYRTDVGLFPLSVGDALLMVGPSRNFNRLAQESDFLVLQRGAFARSLTRKSLYAVVITFLALLVSILGIVPIAEAMLAGAAAMVLSGCLNMDSAYRAVEWRVVFLIAGMLPISIAMTNTGLADRFGGLLVDALAPFGDLALIGGLFIATLLVTQVIAGQVSSLIVGPIAVTAALQVGVNPQAMAAAVAMACSAAFLTPLGHPVNILMMGPGGYNFGDFFRVGIGMVVVSFLTLLVGLIVFWGIS